MKDFLIRLMALMRKEFFTMLRDPKSRMTIILPPIFQMFLFGYAATMDVNTVALAVMDNDRSELSRNYIAAVEGGGIFKRVATTQSEAALSRLIDEKKALIALTIPEDFSRKLQSGQSCNVQVISDGRNSNTAAIASGYLLNITSAYNKKLVRQTTGTSLPISLESRAWYNPNYISRLLMVPSILAMLTLTSSVLFASLSIAREREEGTFDQLLVAPYRPAEILAAKAATNTLLVMGQALGIYLMIVYWFKVPYHGAPLLLTMAVFLIIASSTGIGLCISSFAHSLQQAIVGTFLCLVPMVMLSGITTPVASMPPLFQKLTLANPMRYGVELVRRLFLEEAGFHALSGHFLILSAVTLLTLSACLIAFHRQVNN